jgi:hypothetical protein
MEKTKIKKAAEEKEKADAEANKIAEIAAVNKRNDEEREALILRQKAYVDE